jgi:hypothetical protein
MARCEYEAEMTGDRSFRRERTSPPSRSAHHPSSNSYRHGPDEFAAPRLLLNGRRAFCLMASALFIGNGPTLNTARAEITALAAGQR